MNIPGDDFDEIQQFEEVFICETEDDFKYCPKEDKSLTVLRNVTECSTMYETALNKVEDHSPEYDAVHCDNLLQLNKQIILSLSELKKHITLTLQKCEKKLAVVESSLQKHSISDAKVLICNAGMPYFKDRNYFFPPNNKDELLKESRGELQVENLPKVCSWSPKERNILLKTIRQEAISNVLNPHEETESDSDVETHSKSKSKKKIRSSKLCFPKDFRDMIGPLGAREFDWFKIATAHFEDRHTPNECRVMWNVFLHPDVNKNKWKKPEDTKLKEVAKRFNFQNWDKIAQELGTNRTGYQCFIRYNTTQSTPNVRNCEWNPKEDEKLVRLIELFKIGDFIPWGEVASWMGNRTKQQAYFRWNYSLAPYLIKGRFTKTEDTILRDAVIKYGTNFRKISALLMPNRSAVQLNDHYQRLIFNKIKNSNIWTIEEDAKLLKLYEELGPNWSQIAKDFPCKSRTHLRHRYSALQRYSKRGVSILDLHEDSKEQEGEEEEAGGGEKEAEEEEQRIESNESTDNDLESDCTLNNNFNDDVDKEILEYFRAQRPTKELKTSKLYTAEELASNTRGVYNILQILNAKLDIPDEIDHVQLSDKQKQLLNSLKNYMAQKNDKQTNLKQVEKCSLYMFKTCSNENQTHFIPPPPFEMYMKSRKISNVDQTDVIDYNLDTSVNFLLEQPPVLHTTDFRTSGVAGKDRDLQLKKLDHFIQSIPSSNVLQRVRKLCILSPKMLQRKNLNATTSKKTESTINSDTAAGSSTKITNTCDSNVITLPHKTKLQYQVLKSTAFNLLEEPSNFSPIPMFETPIKKKEIPAIETTYATLVGYKNLLYLKRLYGYKTARHGDIDCSREDFQKAYNLLRIRLEQLFKYPIGLSKTTLPQLYDTETFNEAPRNTYNRSRKRRTKRGGETAVKKLKTVKRR